jgi:hypothetical protein
MRSPMIVLLFLCLGSGVLVAGSAEAQTLSEAQELRPDAALTAVRVSMLTAQVFDLSTTTYGIGAGVVTEANPLMRWAADEPIGLAAMKLGSAAALDWSVRTLARRGKRKTALMLGIGLAASTFVVSAHNMREIRQAQQGRPPR